MIIMRSLIALSGVVSLAGSAYSQVAVKGESVKAKVINTANFAQQINPSVGKQGKTPEHFKKWEFPAGPTVNLSTGGTFSETRIIKQGSLFPGIGATGSEPPDPDIAVSATHIVEAVNSDIAFFDKSGTKLLQQSGQEFFKSIAPEAFDFDPKVIFDHISKKFIVLDLGLNEQATGGTSSLLVGVSDDADPRGTWQLFKIDVKQVVSSTQFWLDYPGFGFSKDMIAFSGNMFQMAGNGENGTQIIVLDKATLYGGTATPFKFSLPNDFTVQLAKTYDTTTSSIYGVSTLSGTQLNLTAIKRNSATSFEVKQTPVSIPQRFAYNSLITGPGGKDVQANDPRILVSAQRNGRLVASHSNGVSASDRRVAARWYEFKTNNWPEATTPPTLVQSGQLNPPTGHGYSFPAVTMDARGSIGITFSQIGTSTPGQVMGAGRKATDPAGFMSSPTILENSTATVYNGFTTRWGDYFDLELDTTDGVKLWAVGMGAGANGRWQTFIKSFQIAVDETELNNVAPDSVAVLYGRRISGDPSSVASNDGRSYVIQSAEYRGLGQVATVRANFSGPALPVSTYRFTYTITAPTNSSTILLLLNHSTGQYEQVNTTSQAGGKVTKNFDLSPAQLAKYLDSSNRVAAIIRTVLPLRGGAMPQAFRQEIDRLGILWAPPF